MRLVLCLLVGRCGRMLRVHFRSHCTSAAASAHQVTAVPFASSSSFCFSSLLLSVTVWSGQRRSCTGSRCVGSHRFARDGASEEHSPRRGCRRRDALGGARSNNGGATGSRETQRTGAQAERRNWWCLGIVQGHTKCEACCRQSEELPCSHSCPFSRLLLIGGRGVDVQPRFWSRGAPVCGAWSGRSPTARASRARA